MKYAVLLLTLVSLALLAQTPDQIRLPSGKTWQEELIAHNYSHLYGIQTVGLRLRRERLHLFDARTGRRLS